MTSDSMRDNPNLIAVPVIVSFNTRGEVLPLYFKFKQETVKFYLVHKLISRLAAYGINVNMNLMKQPDMWNYITMNIFGLGLSTQKNIHTKKGIHSDSFFHGIIMRMYNFLKM